MNDPEYPFYPAFANNQDKGFIFQYIPQQDPEAVFRDLSLKNEYRNPLLQSFPNMSGQFSEDGNKLFLFSEDQPENDEEAAAPSAVFQFVEFNDEKGLAVMIFGDENDLGQALHNGIQNFYGMVQAAQGGRRRRGTRRRRTQKKKQKTKH